MIIEYHHHIDEALDKLSDFFRVLVEANHFGHQIGSANHAQVKTYQDVFIFAYRKSKSSQQASPFEMETLVDLF